MAICNICSCSCPMSESICEHCFFYQDEKCPRRKKESEEVKTNE